jgi:hypothetical protein
MAQPSAVHPPVGADPAITANQLAGSNEKAPVSLARLG